jgi:hypothetical protein
MALFGYILAFVWGIGWAAILQYTEIGRFLARKRTWVTVVIGVGVDLLILLPLVGLEAWLQMGLVIGLSAVGIIGRSLMNEYRELIEQVRQFEGRR